MNEIRARSRVRISFSAEQTVADCKGVSPDISLKRDKFYDKVQI